LTHEEMAQLIGTSRETVTRTLSQFKKQKFLDMSGSTLVIRNKSALERMVGC
jgi:CRP/FNR family transcriptional regulator, cyclic AMP receptor protein